MLQLHLLRLPDAGFIIPGLAGLRKLRWRPPGRASEEARGLSITGITGEWQVVGCTCFSRNEERSGRFDTGKGTKRDSVSDPPSYRGFWANAAPKGAAASKIGASAGIPFGA